MSRTFITPVGEEATGGLRWKKIGCITRQRAVESWLLEHVGLVLMGPCAPNDRLLWLLSGGISRPLKLFQETTEVKQIQA